ncbi:hypothetical protein AVEN_158958-1 [Araneus ventricosus]|uniref:Reverse transcriptase domain-containing protein n=1 Tax=Araneus ventricosus TaxID=182803 RepID=A0A4Y2BAP7_ARAVE|nr:hypothetical protein AVEN_158958-1 [Araneus ventricosus]
MQLKICKIIEKVRRIARATWGLKPSVVKEIYLVVLEKILMYGSEIWYSDKVKLNNKLLQMQRPPLLSLTKAYSTTSTDALHVLSGCPPLDLKVRTHVMTSEHIQLIKNSREIGGHQSFDFETAREPWEVVKISWSLFDESQTFVSVIYTDGSKVQNRVGCAFFHFQENDEIFSELFRPSDEETVSMDEVLAIRQAVKIQIKNAAQREILEAWQQRWSGSSNARWTYLLLSKVDSKRIYGDFFLNQVFTGHGVFPCHQARLFRKDPQCLYRRADGSIFHVLFELKMNHFRQSWPRIWQGKELKDLLKIEFFRRACSDIVKELFNIAFPL